MERLLALLVLSQVALLPAWTQSTFGTITGVVTDPAGLAVAGAAVEIVNNATGIQYASQTNEAGVYTVPQLPDGEYTVRVRAPGFKEFAAQNVRLSARDIRRVDARLEVGSVEARIEVTAGAALIETETARIGYTKTADLMMSLPLNSRSTASFVTIDPTVRSTTASMLRFAGSRRGEENHSLDGISFTSINGSWLVGMISLVESFSEMRVDAVNNTAEYGTIGQVTVFSKAGTNEFHGAAFNYYTAAGLNARNTFALTRGTGVSHSPGLAGGGPLYLPRLYNGRNKTFWYTSLELVRGSQVRSMLAPTVPLPSWRQGDFANVPTPLRDPFAGGTPFPGNRIPASRISSVSRTLQDKFYPLPNFGDPNVLSARNYQEMGALPFSPNQYFSTRIDHRFSDQSSIYGRITWKTQRRYWYLSSLPTLGVWGQSWPSIGPVVSYTYVIRPNLVNEVRWGLSYSNLPGKPMDLAPGLQFVKQLGLVGLATDIPDLPSVPKIFFTGVGVTGISLSNEYNDPLFKHTVNQWQDHLSWFRGRHSIKSGAQVTRVQYEDYAVPSCMFSCSTFTNRFSGHPYADFLLGLPSSSSRNWAPLTRYIRRWMYEFFVTDEFKVTPKVTLNLGLRYELKQHPWDPNGRNGFFDIGTQKVIVSDGGAKLVSPLMPKDWYVPIVEASTVGLPKTLIGWDKNNVAPRFGAAWRPFGNDTVFRAGYGIFYVGVPNTGFAAGQATPFWITEPAFTNPAGAPQVIFPRVYPDVGATPYPGLPNAVNPAFRTGYSQQWNFTIAHQRWNNGFRISYIGTNLRQGQWGYNINQPLPDTRLFIDKPRPFPWYGPSIYYMTHGAGHQYHALTLEIRRSTRDLAYQFAWTWAKDIEDLERGEQPENTYDRRRERYPSDTPKFEVKSYVVWRLPVGRGRSFLSGAGRALDLLVGGWEISAMYLANSGDYLTPSWTGPDPTGTAYTASRTPATVTRRPNCLANPNLARDQRGLDRWFDSSVFTAPDPGSFGTCGRGVILGPGSNTVNAGLFKTFRLWENVRVRPEITATSVLNKPNWGNPGTSITTLTTLGRITSAGGNRNIRLGVRMEW